MKAIKKAKYGNNIIFINAQEIRKYQMKNLPETTYIFEEPFPLFEIQ